MCKVCLTYTSEFGKVGEVWLGWEATLQGELPED